MLNRNDLELLSAYLDGALSEAERAALETRLQTDTDLRRELSRLRATVELIKSLPTLSPPRDLRLTPRMARRSSVLTSAAFSAMSAAAAVILLVVGTLLFTLQGQSAAPPAMLAMRTENQVVVVPTSAAPPVAQEGDTAGEALPSLEDTSLTERGRFDTQQAQSVNEPNVRATQTASSVYLLLLTQEAPVDGLLMPVPQEATESRDANDFGFAAPTATPAPTRMFTTALPSEPPQAAAVGAAAQGDEETGSDQRLTREQQGQQETTIEAGQALESAAAAPTLLSTATPPPTETVTLEPTMTRSSTATPTPTRTATLPPATPTPTLTPTPIPPSVEITNPSLFGVGLIAAAVILFGVALVTTLLRRRS